MLWCLIFQVFRHCVGHRQVHGHHTIIETVHLYCSLVFRHYVGIHSLSGHRHWTPALFAVEFLLPSN